MAGRLRLATRAVIASLRCAVKSSSLRVTAFAALRAAASAAGLVVATLPLLAHAGYPDRPIRLVVPNEAGTGPDLLARLLASSMAGLGQPVVVENKLGANGNIASAYVAKSAADGYTLYIVSDAQVAINPHVFAKLSFDPKADFVPVATIGSSDLLLCINPALPAKNLKEFIDYARAQPVPLSYGSASNGTQSHLLMELLKSRAGISMQHVPYRGGAAAAVAVMSGEIAAVFGGTSLKQQIQSNRLRLIATTGPRRSTAFPDVPTVSETVPGFEGQLWIGMLAPSGTPAEVQTVLRAAVQNFLTSPTSVEKLAALGMDPLVTTPEQFKALIVRDDAKYGQLVRDIGVKLD